MSNYQGLICKEERKFQGGEVSWLAYNKYIVVDEGNVNTERIQY